MYYYGPHLKWHLPQKIFTFTQGRLRLNTLKLGHLKTKPETKTEVTFYRTAPKVRICTDYTAIIWHLLYRYNKLMCDFRLYYCFKVLQPYCSKVQPMYECGVFDKRGGHSEVLVCGGLFYQSRSSPIFSTCKKKKIEIHKTFQSPLISSPTAVTLSHPPVQQMSRAPPPNQGHV